MTLSQFLAFSFGMLVLAIVPGPGVATVVSRTLGSGRLAGLAVIAGLVVGDIIFMGLAIAGLSAVAATMAPLFHAVKYAGAAYLIWLGYGLLIGGARQPPVAPVAVANRWREAGIGLLVTLGNPKPILFYGALMPTFFDMTAVGLRQFGLLAGIVAVVSYVVLGCYALAADRTRRLLWSSRAERRIKRATGLMLIGSGVLVASR